jgi:NADPH2:quinone reductase
VRIRVEAAGAHLVDTVLRSGQYQGGPMPLPELPTVPGREVAGTVDAVGDDVPLDQLGGREVSGVLDGVGGDEGRSALELLGTGGRFLMFVWSAGSATEVRTDDIVAKALTVTWAIGPHLVERYDGGLRALESFALDRATSGRWTPLITRFPLDKAAGANHALEARGTVGKAVLIP